MKRKILFLFTFVFISTLVIAQSPKKFYKTGVKFAESGKTQDAIDNFTKSLNLDPNYIKSYVARAEAYVLTSNSKLALEDYERALTLDPKEEDYAYMAAKLSLELKQYKRAIVNADKAILQHKKHLKAYHVKILSLYYLDLLDEALENANKAVNYKRKYITYFDKAEILFAKKQFKDAQDFYQLAISKNEKNINGYIGIANAYFYQDLFDQTISSTTAALAIDARSKDALWIRSRAYHKKMDYLNSINDLSQIILLYPKESFTKDVFYERGLSYFAYSQHNNAVNDFTKVISLDHNYYQAYFKRAEAYIIMNNIDKAISDYEQLDKLSLKDEEAVAMLDAAHKKLFELKREDDKPTIVISMPFIDKNKKMQIIKGTEIQKISGRIDDASKIKSLTINGDIVKFDPTSKKNEFFAEINVKGKSEIKVVCSDIYDNVRTIVYSVLYTEVGKPEIHLILPMASDDGQLYLEGNSSSLYIEGTIADESKIASITIDKLNASYIPTVDNPSFNATVDIKNKKQITIEVKDIYGNITVRSYLLNRDGATVTAANPMGKTWVIFIENSKYKTFASLNGPTKDISMMKSALASYNINHIIHKRNMTKVQMERFFSIELRDQVIKNRVNSIVVWYAGHGKFLNNTGYWVPVDGKTDDEFTYFNISSLKSAMNSYSAVITHTLVITDACESGPSFYQAMRGDVKNRDCGDWKATKFKSSQVFSSAGYELASDNSQFTKTFANSLRHNPNNCIPIGSIVKKVKTAVKRNKQQEPEFGKIDGLPDENGTFFFIRK